jgi:hypothetical protein
MHARKAHEDLDAHKVAGPSSPLAGKTVRESRDSDEHPTSIPVAVIFDVTGSMGRVPHEFLPKLKELFSLVLRKGYIEHPQVLIGAVGDTHSDRVPLQVGQFESDNRVDETLDKIFIEGGGGGGDHESYNLALWYMANCTATDAMEKRSKKGYLFMIGDERTYDELTTQEIEAHTGVTGVQGPVSIEDIFTAVQEKWETFFIVPTRAAGATYDHMEHQRYWEKWLPSDRVLILENAADVAELIAVTIGVEEGAIDVDEGLEDLKEIGSTAGGTVSKALAKRGGGSGGGVATIEDAPSDLDTTDEDESERV